MDIATSGYDTECQFTRDMKEIADFSQLSGSWRGSLGGEIAMNSGLVRRNRACSFFFSRGVFFGSGAQIN